MTSRNPLRPQLNLAAMIADLRLDQRDLTPEARRAAAEAAAAFMTPAQRTAVAERNSARYDEAAHKIKLANAMMRQPGRAEQRAMSGAIPHACPRCGAPVPEARGRSDEARADWLGSHYNAAHGGY